MVGIASYLNRALFTERFSAWDRLGRGRAGSHVSPLNFKLGESEAMIKKFLRDETGAELAEYAVGVALLVAIGIVVYKVLGDAINESNSTTGNKIKTAEYK